MRILLAEPHGELIEFTSDISGTRDTLNYKKSAISGDTYDATRKVAVGKTGNLC
jgi:hypothetical protein